jgi:hypothetical protein
MNTPSVEVPESIRGARSPIDLEDCTVLTPKYYEGLADVSGDARQHRRYFTYKTDAGLVAGTATSVMFTIDRPSEEVWRYFKDFNLWQNSYHHYYSGVVGDLEGGTVRLTVGSDLSDPNRPWGEYQVVRVIPRYLIVKSQIPKPQFWPEHGRIEGIGGFMVFMLNEHEAKTVITILMQHDRVTKDVTEEQALGFWQTTAPENLMKWRDFFIPTLKTLIYQNK